MIFVNRMAVKLKREADSLEVDKTSLRAVL